MSTEILLPNPYNAYWVARRSPLGFSLARNGALLWRISAEALKRLLLGVEGLDDPGQSGVVEDEPDLVGEVEGLQFPSPFLAGDISGQDIADAVAIHEVHMLEVEKDFLFPSSKLFFDQSLDRGARFFGESNLADKVEDDRVPFFPDMELHALPR